MRIRGWATRPGSLVAAAAAAAAGAVAVCAAPAAVAAPVTPAPPPPSQAIFLTTDFSPDGLVAKAHDLQRIAQWLWDDPPLAFIRTLLGPLGSAVPD